MLELSHYDEVVKVAKSGLAKKHVFGGEATVAGTGRKTLACASAIQSLLHSLTANGCGYEQKALVAKSSRSPVQVL